MRIVHRLCLVACMALVAVAFPATAQDLVKRGEVPSWVKIAPEMPVEPTAAADGIRILLFDTQFRAETDQQSYYVRTRTQALSPQALPVLGNVSLAWNPASQDITVHSVTVIRDGQAIDVLATQSFETLRREENLEQATLDGVLTASLQPSGLRINDILDVSYTIVSRDPVIGGHAEQGLELNLPAVVDRTRYRASWPRSMPVRLRASNDWTPLRVQRDGDYAFVEVERDAAQPVVVPADVPGRLRAVNTIELSDYADWSDIAATLKPLFDQARQLPDASPLKAEIERIRALSDDPSVQAEAALRRVQDEVRYVALLLGEGALTPATADETWTRRFGDCKAKTALLLALLDGLGIEAEPALVSIQNGDGLAERLPMIGTFDHILVRAVVDGRTYWLDGTRSGDRALATLSVPPFGWALPLKGANAQLEPLIVAPLTEPDNETIVTIDVSAGLYAPVNISAAQLIRGDGAAALGGMIGMLTVEQRDQTLRDLWKTEFGSTEITEVKSAYDEDANILTLSMTGTSTQTWVDAGVIIPGSTLARLTTEDRAEGPFRDAPFAVEHPIFIRRRTILRLPAGVEGVRLTGGSIDRTEMGYHVQRSVSLDADTATVVTSRRSLVSEITAAEAAEAKIAQGSRDVDAVRIFRPRDYALTEADRANMADAPTTAAGWIYRAYALFQAGDNQGAFEAADKAVAIAPDSSSAWANRGVYQFWLGNPDAAAADLDKAADLDPSERIAMNGHALIAMDQKRYDDAVIELSRALRQVPGDEWTLRLRSTAYIELKDYDRALRDMDTIIAARPDDATLKMERIGMLNVAGRDDQADADMEALVAAQPDAPNVMLNYAALRLRREDFQSARESLDRILASENANRRSALYLRGKAFLGLGQIDLARQDFDALRAENPDNPGTLNNICWAAALAGVMLEQAQKDCDAAVALKPDVANYIGSRARVLLQRGEVTQALAAFEANLAIEPDAAISLYGRGLARIALGQVAQGEADKAAAIALSADAPDSFKNYRPTEATAAP